MTSKTRVAVYGSLRRGFGNHRLLENAEFIGTTMTQQPYAMYSLGGFPKVVLGESQTPIVVEIYDVTDNELVSLDRLEGYRGPDAQNFYDRTVIPTGLGDAWIYHIEGNNGYRTEPVASGDWANRRG